jgi:hypothetical protein
MISRLTVWGKNENAKEGVWVMRVKKLLLKGEGE